MSHGSTPEKALKEIKSALEVAIKWMIEEGEPIPVPFGIKKFSGKLPLRTSEEIHRKIAMEASEQGISINQYIISKIS